MRRRQLLVVATVVVALALAVALQGHLGDIGARFQKVLQTLGDVRPGWVGLSLVLLGLSCFVRAFRWYMMILPAAPRATVGGVFGATLIGFTAVVLFGRPGELVRPYLIACRTESAFSSQAAAWVLERIWDLLAVILIFACALSQIHVDADRLGPGLQRVLRTGGSVAFALAAGAIVALIAVRFLSAPMQAHVLRSMQRLPKAIAPRLEQVIGAFLGGMACTQRWSQLGYMAGLTAVEWAVISAQTYAILQAFPPSAHLSGIDSLVFLGFVAFGSVIQVPGIGGGVQVAGAVVLAELFGVQVEAATAVAIGFWVLSWVALVPAGAVAALASGVSWRSLRQIKAEAEPTTSSCAAPGDGVPERMAETAASPSAQGR